MILLNTGEKSKEKMEKKLNTGVLQNTSFHQL